MSSRFDTYKGKGYSYNAKQKADYSAKRKSARDAIVRANRTPFGVPAQFGVRAGLRAEVKTIDTPAVTQTLSSTSSFALLNPIQEGSSFYNRIGRKICLRSIRLTGQIVARTGVATSGTYDYIRIMIVYDRQANGAFPSIADILLTYDNTGATTTTVLSHLNMNNAERFKIVRDIRIAISNDAVAAANIQDEQIIDYKGKYNIDEYAKLKGYESHYKASSNPAVIGDVSTGGLYLVTFGGNPAASAGYALNWTARCRYTDV